jgi:thiamine biosynthesis lipoprotein
MINLANSTLLSSRFKAQLPLGFIVFMVLSGCAQEPKLQEIHGFTMGTTYTVKWVPQDSPSFDPLNVKAGVDSVLVEVNREMSTYIPDSQVSQYNRAVPGSAVPVSPGFLTVVQRAEQWYELTRGALNIAIMPLLEVWGFGPHEKSDTWSPPDSEAVLGALKKIHLPVVDLKNSRLLKDYADQSLDLGAIAKGWGVDQVFFYLQHLGLNHFLVEIGGEIRTRGTKAPEKPWSIGIDTPVKGSAPGQNLSAIIPISDQAMATSGDYRNYFEYQGRTYSHILNPITGYPADSGVASVTVTAPNCTDADALATALMILDPTEGLELIEALDGYEGYWIIRGGDGKFTTAKSSGMNLNPDPAI